MSANTAHHLECCCMCELPAVIFGMPVSLDKALTAVMWWQSWCRVTSIRSSCLHSPWALTTSKSFSTKSSEVRHTHTHYCPSFQHFISKASPSDTHSPRWVFLHQISWVEKQTITHTFLLRIPYYLFSPETMRRNRRTTHSLRTHMGEQEAVTSLILCLLQDS